MRRLRDVRRKRKFSVNRKRSAKLPKRWQPSKRRPQLEAKAPNKLPRQNQHPVLPPLRVNLSSLGNRKVVLQKRSRRRKPINVPIARMRKRRKVS